MGKNYFSKIYSNDVFHKRLLPFDHKFKYSLISLLIDYDELKKIDKEIVFFSYNKFNLFSFYDKDHGYRNNDSLKKYVEEIFKKNSIKFKNISIKILCLPRILGYVFNPISVIYCFENNDLVAILYEVKNTSNEQHTYCFAGNKTINKNEFHHKCNKIFYVSPFIEMKCYYQFTTKIPDSNLHLLIEQFDSNNKKILIASQKGIEKNFTSATLMYSFFAYPLMTFKVILGIHFEAMKIFFKGGKYYSRIKKSIDTDSFEGSL
tara:strand:+ start:2597 stop:3382 length:786 start_codon:yes stop_codon:yes gene_type:complete